MSSGLATPTGHGAQSPFLLWPRHPNPGCPWHPSLAPRQRVLLTRVGPRHPLHPGMRLLRAFVLPPEPSSLNFQLGHGYPQKGSAPVSLTTSQKGDIKAGKAAIQP